MESYVLARVVHILGVVIWIGGVAMVTMVIIPAVKKLSSPEERVNTFEQIEGRFALIAKFATVLTGLSGFYMIYVLDGWGRYLELRYWWMHAMTLIWLVFSVILFVLEPLFLHAFFKKHGILNPNRTFAIMHRLHWGLLVLSLLTTAGAVAGSHGWFWLD